VYLFIHAKIRQHYTRTGQLGTVRIFGREFANAEASIHVQDLEWTLRRRNHRATMFRTCNTNI